MGNDQDLTVYIKGTSSGNQGAYKPLKIRYITNRAPTIGGDTRGNKVEVDEDENNNNQLKEFELFFKDQEGDKIQFEMNPPIDNLKWVRYNVIG
jgi:hypothetical protein